MNSNVEMYPKAIGICLREQFSSKEIVITLAQTYPAIFCEVYQKCKGNGISLTKSVIDAEFTDVAPVVTPISTLVTRKRATRSNAYTAKEITQIVALRKNGTSFEHIANEVNQNFHKNANIRTSVAIQRKLCKLRTLAYKCSTVATPTLKDIEKTKLARKPFKLKGEIALMLSLHKKGHSIKDITDALNDKYHNGTAYRKTTAVYKNIIKLRDTI